jgi:sulfite exporter TauE/SafE
MLNIALSLFISGVLFGSGPCLASCGPILISYIAGTKKEPIKGFFVYVLFSLSRISVYVLLSLGIFSLGRLAMDRFLGSFSKYLLIIGGAFVIVMGLLIISGKRWESGICSYLYKNVLEHDKKSIVILGLIIGLLPCAPLLGLFSYIGLVSKTWVSSLLYSLAFGMGTFLSPLLLLAFASGFITRLFKNQIIPFQRILGFLCGLIIILLGAQLIYRGLSSA